jgi:outer membrane protein TolC
MVKKVSNLLFLFIFLYNLQTLRAQETMMNDISYVYLEKLVAVAMENYPRIKTNESRVKIAEANISKQKMGWLTPLSLSYAYSPVTASTNPGFFGGYQLGFTVSLQQLLQTPFNIRTAREELKVVQNDVAEYQLTLATEVKRRYIAYMQALRMLQLTSKSAISAQSDAALMKNRFERGETTLAEYNNVLDRYSNQNQTKITAEGTMLINKASLEELLGVKLEEVK